MAQQAQVHLVLALDLEKSSLKFSALKFSTHAAYGTYFAIFCFIPYSCAILDDGAVRCWGLGASGQVRLRFAAQPLQSPEVDTQIHSGYPDFRDVW